MLSVLTVPCVKCPDQLIRVTLTQCYTPSTRVLYDELSGAFTYPQLFVFTFLQLFCKFYLLLKQIHILRLSSLLALYISDYTIVESVPEKGKYHTSVSQWCFTQDVLKKHINNSTLIVRTVGRDSSEGIVTRYGLDGLGIESRWGGGRDFPQPSRLLYNGYQVFPGSKSAGCGVDHPRPSSAEVKKRVELYLYSTSGPSWPVIGWTFNLKVSTRCLLQMLQSQDNLQSCVQVMEDDRVRIIAEIVS